jgi:hypothetical protein
MIIAIRVLTLSRPEGDIDIPIRIFAPVPAEIDWSCRFEIDWPDGTRAMDVDGIDAVQAIELVMKAIGSQIYASDHHESGRLVWLKSGRGYGFPVPNGIRDLLVGDDKKFL